MGQPSVGTETGVPGVGGPLWVSAKLLPVEPVVGTVSVMVLLPVPLPPVSAVPPAPRVL